MDLSEKVLRLKPADTAFDALLRRAGIHYEDLV
jgi:hypothetical protein